MDYRPQDWANIFCLTPKLTNQQYPLNLGALSQNFISPTLLSGVCLKQQKLCFVVPPDLKTVKELTKARHILPKPNTTNVFHQHDQFGSHQIPVSWPPPLPDQYSQVSCRHGLSSPPSRLFTRSWHRPGVYQRENVDTGIYKTKTEYPSDTQDGDVDKKELHSLQRPQTVKSSILLADTGATAHAAKETLSSSSRILTGTVTVSQNSSAETSWLCETETRPIHSPGSKKSDNYTKKLSQLLENEQETRSRDSVRFAAAMGLVSVKAQNRKTVWLNVTLQVDTGSEVKQGQPTAQYRSLITNIVTQYYYPPKLSPPDDMTEDVMTATASYDDRGRLAVLQVEFITAGIYKVEFEGSKRSTSAKSSKSVTLIRVESLEVLVPSSQYFILGDLCCVPKSFQKCHRNAQNLHKKLTEHMYSREFRKYTLPWLLQCGEKDVWSDALKAPRTRSRVADHSESTYVIVKRKQLEESRSQETFPDLGTQPKKRKSRRSVETSSNPVDSRCFAPSPPASSSGYSTCSVASPPLSDCVNPANAVVLPVGMGTGVLLDSGTPNIASSKSLPSPSNCLDSAFPLASPPPSPQLYMNSGCSSPTLFSPQSGILSEQLDLPEWNLADNFTLEMPLDLSVKSRPVDDNTPLDLTLTKRNDALD